jgi:hypothetical protein
MTISSRMIGRFIEYTIDVRSMSSTQLCEECCRAKQRVNAQESGYQDVVGNLLEQWWDGKKNKGIVTVMTDSY